MIEVEPTFPKIPKNIVVNMCRELLQTEREG